jgi:3-dehydroquinate dehydratase-2
MKPKIFIIHGPNLNLLGEREPKVYGSQTLEELNQRIRQYADDRRIEVKFFQSNHEGAIIDQIHEARRWADGIVINPGAFTHCSYAIRDAIAAAGLPTVEVHLSDIYHREAFRRVSVIAPVCLAQLHGRGIQSYLDGIERLLSHLRGLKGLDSDSPMA